MVEKAIKNEEEHPSKRQLKTALPKDITRQTFNLVLKYIEYSGKIVIKDGRIIWIANDNPKFLRMLEKAIEV
jgi:DNA-binding transcriptional regulator YhcF (GntR family)